MMDWVISAIFVITPCGISILEKSPRHGGLKLRIRSLFEACLVFLFVFLLSSQFFFKTTTTKL